jgi:hypothetical protein
MKQLLRRLARFSKLLSQVHAPLWIVLLSNRKIRRVFLGCFIWRRRPAVAAPGRPRKLARFWELLLKFIDLFMGNQVTLWSVGCRFKHIVGQELCKDSVIFGIGSPTPCSKKASDAFGELLRSHA